MSRGIKLPESPSEWGFKGENYLLTIGIDIYQHWPPLHNAVKDVRDITRMLTARYQFEPDHVITLFDEEATEDNIRRKLLDVKKSITPDDNLVVYYSGHGNYDPDLDEGYWVPANARKDSPSDYISNSDVLKWIRAIKTHHTLIVVDSCFSGTLVSQSRSAVLSEKYPSCRIFASGRKELVDDGTPGSNSPFAKAILGRLSYNTDRVLRASELIHTVTKVVESEAGQAPIEGRIKDAGDEGGEFVFHLKVTEDEIWASVVASNTAAEYAKYIDYYPDGKYALEARNKLSALTDETDWKRALELNTPAALANYLEAHPRGQHYEEAFKKLEDLEETEAWQAAKTRNTVTAYMEYLRKYPEGQYAPLATRNLDALKGGMQQTERQQVQEALDDIAENTGEAADNKSRYKQLLNEAEGLYAQMAYASCLEKYRAALALYETHYVPDRKFIEQRIGQATARISYLEYLEDGKKAATDGNYTLALQYFRKARDVDDTVKVREWITHVEQKLKGDHAFAPVGPQPKSVPAKTRKKKSRVLPWMIGIAALTVIGIVVGAVISSMQDMRHAYDVIANPYEDITPVYNEDNFAKEIIPATPQRSSVRSLVPGTWNVSDRNILGISASATGTLQRASWVFANNGNVTYWENGVSYSGTWTLNEDGSSFTSVVSVPALAVTGYIYYIDQNAMSLITTELLGQVTNSLIKIQ